MAGKKQPGRFTIQFSPADPQQRQVIELLNQQGRRKAVFLTAAVLSYCGKSEPPSVSLPQQLDLTTIEQAVRKVLQEEDVRWKPRAVPKRREAAPVSNLELQASAAEEPVFSKDILASISDMIDTFKG